MLRFRHSTQYRTVMGQASKMRLKRANFDPITLVNSWCGQVVCFPAFLRFPLFDSEIYADRKDRYQVKYCIV